MYAIIGRILFWSFFAVIVACLEIEIEGKHGWAEKLPTWYRKIPGGKPLTGYNLFMFMVPMMIFHVPFFGGAEWSWRSEFETWAVYFAWCNLWDYFWFVLNPHYTGRFKRDQIWWHAGSAWPLGLFPMDYVVFTAISFIFAGLACWSAGSLDPLRAHAQLLTGFLVFTVFLHLVAPLYKRWYAHMRTRDDRDKIAIFHR